MNSAPLRIAVFLAIGAALLLVIILWRKNQEQHPSGNSHSAVGKDYLPQEFPPLTATEPLTATDLQGKVVLINFWGWWCGPCQLEFPHLMKLATSLEGNPDFRLVSVACSGNPESDESAPELRDRTQAFLTERNATIVTYKDPHAAEQRRLAETAQLPSLGYPLSVVIDRRGIIRGLWLGYQPGDELAMRGVIDQALTP